MDASEATPTSRELTKSKRKPLPTKRPAPGRHEHESKRIKITHPTKKRTPLPTLENRRPYPGMNEKKRIITPISKPFVMKGRRSLDRTEPNLGPSPVVPHTIVPISNHTGETTDEESEESFVARLKSKTMRPSKPRKNSTALDKSLRTPTPTPIPHSKVRKISFTTKPSEKLKKRANVDQRPESPSPPSIKLSLHPKTSSLLDQKDEADFVDEDWYDIIE